MNMLTVAGLGNPEEHYIWSRHNAGYMVLDLIAERRKVAFGFEVRLNALVAYYEHGDKMIRLIKPQTGMNDSGLTLAAAMVGQPLDTLLVVYDDIALSNTVRFQYKGSAGGHRGVESIHKQLDSRDFTKLKLGLGPAPKGDTKPFVTEPVPVEFREYFTLCVEVGAAAVPVWIDQGVERASCQFNGRKF